MKQRPRIYYTESQRALMWERWQKGESLQHIAQLFDRNHSSIQRILAETGGIRPAARRRSRWALTLAEREEISRAVVAGHSMRSIQRNSAERPLRSVGRSSATVARNVTERVRLTSPLGVGDGAPRPLNWHRIERWRASWQPSSDCSGHRSRLPAGSSAPFQTIRAFRCHTRPSIAACSFRPAAP